MEIGLQFGEGRSATLFEDHDLAIKHRRAYLQAGQRCRDQWEPFRLGGSGLIVKSEPIDGESGPRIVAG